jgi:hypothetical protein
MATLLTMWNDLHFTQGKSVFSCDF